MVCQKNKQVNRIYILF